MSRRRVGSLISLTFSLPSVPGPKKTLKRTRGLSCRRQDYPRDEFRFFFDPDRGLFTGCSLHQRSPSSPPWAVQPLLRRIGLPSHRVQKKLAPYPLRPAVRLRYIPSSACTSTSPQQLLPSLSLLCCLAPPFVSSLENSRNPIRGPRSDTLRPTHADNFEVQPQCVCDNSQRISPAASPQP